MLVYRLEKVQCGSVSLVSATWALPSPPTRYAPGTMWWFGNRTAAKARPLQEAGAVLAERPKGAPSGADVAFTMSADDSALDAVTVTSGEQGCIAKNLLLEVLTGSLGRTHPNDLRASATFRRHHFSQKRNDAVTA